MKKSKKSSKNTVLRENLRLSQSLKLDTSSNSEILNPSEIESLRRDFRNALERTKGRFSHLK